MKCQILFSGKNKKNIINLPSAENAQRVVKVKSSHNWAIPYEKQTIIILYIFCIHDLHCKTLCKNRIRE